MSKTVHVKANSYPKVKGKHVEKKKVSSIKWGILLKVFIPLLVLVGIAGCVYSAINTVEKIKSIRMENIISGHDAEYLVESGVVRKSVVIVEDGSAENKIAYVLVVLFNQDNAQSLVYYIPSWVYVPDGGSNSYISVSNLSYAAESYSYENKSGYVISKIENLIGISFDSYIWIKKDASGFFGEEYQEVFSKLNFLSLLVNYRTMPSIVGNISSNLSFNDLIVYFQRIDGSLTADGSKILDLSDETYLKNMLLENGSNVSVVNTEVLDQKLAENSLILRSKSLERELVKVEVYNGSGKPGLAREYARKITNAGCVVVRYDNSPEDSEKNIIYVPRRSDFPESLKVVQQIIGKNEIMESRPQFMTTGDIIVILGKEL